MEARSLRVHGHDDIVRFVPTMMADESVIRRVANLLETAACSDRVQPQYVRPVDLAYLRKLQQIAG